jgi:hypothetical protein
MHEYFLGAGNKLNTILEAIYFFALFAYLAYSHCLVWINYHKIGRREVQERLANQIDGAALTNIHQASLNVYFMYRRVITAAILVFGYQYPAL